MLRAAGFFCIVAAVAAHKHVPQKNPDSRPPLPSTAPDGEQQAPLAPPTQAPVFDAVRSGVRNLFLFPVAYIPSWFPGHAHETHGGHNIQIKPETWEKFKDLDKKKLTWMYHIFFLQAAFAASQKHKIVHNEGFYKKFTPPWYRGDFDAGNQRFFSLKITQLVNKRKLRTETGLITISLTLAAF